jgi:hypothetical protein
MQIPRAKNRYGWIKENFMAIGDLHGASLVQKLAFQALGKYV